MQKKNDFQKQLVRINIEILNAFHFDLSSAENEPMETDECTDGVKKDSKLKPSNSAVENSKFLL